MNEKVRRFGGKAVAEVGETIRFLGGVVAVWFVLVTFVFAAFHIPSESMQPAIQVGDRVLVFDKPRWDPTDPEAYGATITYDFDAQNGGIPFQTTKEDTHAHGPN